MRRRAVQTAALAAIATAVAVTVAQAAGAAHTLGASPAGRRPAPTAAATETARCGPSGARTLAADAGARIFVVHQTAYGCAAGSSRTYRLGGSGGFCNTTSQVGPVALAGRMAGYGLRRCGVDTADATVTVRDLGDGRTRATFPALTVDTGAESFETVDDVVVRADGTVAWIASSASIAAHRKATELIASGQAGRVRVLASGSAIGIGSLRLRGSRLSWQVDGRPASAEL